MIQKGPETASGWRFFYTVILPISLGAIATIATVGSFIAWSTSRNDDDALLRQVNLVSHILHDQRGLVAQEQEEVATWDNAVKAVSGNLDLNFIKDNFGLGMYEYYGHDRSYLLDPKFRSVYAMRNGISADAAIFETERSALEPLAQRLREINWQGALNAYVNGASENVPSITDIVMIEGQPAIVSLMPVVSRNQNTQPAPGTEFIHITSQFLDAELAAELTDLLLLQGARFSINSEIPDTETAQTIRNNAGDPVAYFAWVPDRPGARLFAETAPAFGGVVTVAAIIIAILVLQLRRSITQLETGRAAAQYMALHDALTGLGNRVMFETSVTQGIKNLERGGDQLALLIIDLDRFKQVNDTLGHEAGDELIQQVAQRLQPLVRNTDTIARIGGDEFAIVAGTIGSDEHISVLCNRIVKSIRRPFDLRAGQAFVGASIGVSLADDPHVDRVELTRKADIALYEAKSGGRNQYRIFEEHMNVVVQRRQTIEDDLRKALRTDDQLDVAFEPLVREENDEVFGVEAKIVWHHPEIGNIPADTFLPVAESCGLIEIIGDFVLHRACEAGAKTPDQITSVHAFPPQLRNPNFFNKVFSIIEDTGMNPNNLELQIEEKMLSPVEETAHTALRKLRQAGVSIALSNFGTGFTSLRLLQQFQVDRIKIDRSFISELAQSPDPEAITHAVVWLARAIGVEVSADGVDTLEQKKFLARMGCMSFQGNLFSPEGQASWLRVAANLEKNLARKPDTDTPTIDIEMWDNTGS